MHFHCKLCKCLPHNVTSDLLVYMQHMTSIYTERPEMKLVTGGAIFMSPAEGHLGQIRHMDVSPAWSLWAPLLPLSSHNCLREHHRTKLRTVEMHWHHHARSSMVMGWVSYLWLRLQILSYLFMACFIYYF